VNWRFSGSWHVSVAAEAIAAALFTLCGYDVSVQDGADQPEYDLMVAKGEKMFATTRSCTNATNGVREHTPRELSKRNPSFDACGVAYIDNCLRRIGRPGLGVPYVEPAA
jgi:hypothetical protein